MNLFQLLDMLSPTLDQPEVIPAFLYGAFRRKSISFYNGLTDENTIVYWFQSRSFTIDLRLKSQNDTWVHERQGWIGNTVWNYSTQLLSWEVEDYANYQNHVQWPEPAQLHAIGNCILEFSPSNVYVEDWRQQVNQGLFLGLRLKSAVDVTTGQILKMDGGLIICGAHIAYALSRLPASQAVVSNLDFSNLNTTASAAVESFEVSVSTDGLMKTYSTSAHESGHPFNFDDFDLVSETELVQHVILEGRKVDLSFEVDMLQPDYAFQYQTETSAESQNWLQSEQHHLMHHTKAVF